MPTNFDDRRLRIFTPRKILMQFTDISRYVVLPTDNEIVFGMSHLIRSTFRLG